MKFNYLYILFLISLAACAPKSSPIDYGVDMCDFCRMTVVDQIHGAELVTSKGKTYKFDAIECMVHFVKDHDKDYAFKLVNHYQQPKELIDADKASFLISKKLPSPMGAYLTAFKSRKEAEKVQLKLDGKIYTWEELVDVIDKKY